MSQKQKTEWRRPRLKVWQRLFLAVALLIVLGLCSTLFHSFSRDRTADPTSGTDAEAAESAAPAGGGWDDGLYGYVITGAGDSDLTVPFYNEALAEKSRCGRGAYVQLESWEPFVSESGREYYHVYFDGVYGYIPCEYISDDKADVIQETQVYVRTSVDLLSERDGCSLGQLAGKGDLLRIVGYDYFRPDGTVNMYEVKLGTEIGWIPSDFVVSSYAEALETWNNETNVYSKHVQRGDSYGGGDAAELDYWPHTKGDFAAQGNAMPASCASLYVSIGTSSPEQIRQYLAMAEGTAINTFVFTICDGTSLAYRSDLAAEYGVLDAYEVINSTEDFLESVRLVQEAGYYTVARISTFRDTALATVYPQWSITDLSGQPLEIKGDLWPSVYCREAWEFKVGFALEAVETFGFHEIQFDNVRFPDFIKDYEDQGAVDMKNAYRESKAQAIQRFFTYAAEVLHAHNTYISAVVLGETSNDYVAPCGQYWDAISTVVDVICGTPYPDDYAATYINGYYYRYASHPYNTLYDWAIHVVLRQSECSSPAIVRTWLQTWDSAGYHYGPQVIEREIVALFDADITGGYMPWFSTGSITVPANLEGVIERDYYALYLEAEAQDVKLSEYLEIDTTE